VLADGPPPEGRFTDGEWHRLHPLTPLLKGGIAFVAVIGIIVVNLRDILIEQFFGNGSDRGEPLVWISEHGFVGVGIAAFLLLMILFVVGFYVSWRMHTFRITDEVVEVRSGILFRTNRKGRLDRIQGINIGRPFLARLVGAAKLEVNVAGQDANVQLDYLGSAAADELRRDILLLASGTRVADAAAPAAPGTLVDQLIAPELDPSLAPPESVVKMHLGRLLGSLVLSGATVFVVILVIGLGVTFAITGEFFFVGFLVPAIIATVSFYYSRFTKSLRYSIAGTPDGVRVGFGLLSTSNETLPPGRIHSVQVSQPLLWRPAGWWEIKVNRASTSSAKGAAGQANTTILPVGNLDDVRKVLALVLPGVDAELLVTGLVSAGGDDGFVNSPRRAAPLRWFSWRRNGFALTPSAVLLRKGAIFRELVIVPQARMQSVALTQGPLLRRLGLAEIKVHTVAGPITPTLGAIDRDAALAFFADAAAAAISSATNDTSHRWRTGEATV
jgi:putative membrane protein